MRAGGARSNAAPVSGFAWDERSARWRNLSSGRFVSRSTVMGEVNSVLDVSAQSMNAYADQFGQGRSG